MSTTEIVLRIAATVALAIAACSALAHGDGDGHAAGKPAYDATKVEQRAFGREGDPKQVSRTIRIEMSDAMRYSPSHITIRRGETVRFVAANRGRQLHEIVIGTPEELETHAALMRQHPGMEHDDANMAHVQPGASGEIVWQFTQAGEFRFACLIPGHYEAGMVGRITVK